MSLLNRCDHQLGSFWDSQPNLFTLHWRFSSGCFPVLPELPGINIESPVVPPVENAQDFGVLKKRSTKTTTERAGIAGLLILADLRISRYFEIASYLDTSTLPPKKNTYTHRWSLPDEYSIWGNHKEMGQNSGRWYHQIASS